MQTALQALAFWFVPVPEEIIIYYKLLIFDFCSTLSDVAVILFIIAYVCASILILYIVSME